MSFDPTQYPQAQYSGTPFNQTVSILNPAEMSPRIVPLTFNWLVYFTALNSAPNISVPINLQGGANQGGIIDRIRSVKIDNSNSAISVSVYFPDTGDIVTCAPNTVTVQPCMTNGLRCFVIAQGLTAGFTPITKVYLSNLIQPPSVDPQTQLVFPQWLGSPNIQRSNILTPGYGPPALGDQTQQIVMNLAVNQPPVPTYAVFGAPYALGFITLTAISLNMTGVNSAGAVNMFASFRIFSTGSAGILYDFRHTFVSTAPVISFLTLFSQTGLNIKLDATQSWFVEWLNLPGSGSNSYAINSLAQFIFSYTYNPNQ